MIKIIVSPLLLLVSSQALAMDCSMGTAVRCMCAASLTLHCENNYTGFVRNEERPQRVAVSVLDRSTGQARTLTIDNPSGSVRDFYGRLERNPDISRAMMDAGMRRNANTEIQVQAVQMRDDLTLYEDAHGNQPVARGSQAGYDYACSWTTTPSFITAPSCGNRGLCTGMVSCTPRGQNSVIAARVACPALGSNRCPSASDCGASPTVEISDSPTTGRDGEAVYSPVRGVSQ